MKRIISIITSITILLCSFTLLIVSAATPAPMPSQYPLMRFTSTYNSAQWAWVLTYCPSVNSYRLFSISNEFEYMDKDYLYVVYNATNFCFYFEYLQPHISSNQTFKYFTDEASTQSDGTKLISFRERKAFNNPNTNTAGQLSFDTDLTQMLGTRTVVASTVDIFYIDENGSKNLLVKGNETYFNSFFEDGYEPPLSMSHESCLGSEPTTDAPSSDNAQLEVSNNILENIKSLLETVFNLPEKIANAIGGSFTFLKDSIIGGLVSLQNAILDGLEYLFVPSDDNKFEQVKEIMSTKFGVFSQLYSFANVIVDMEFKDEPPDFNITMYGHTVTIIDWSIYADYRTFVHGIIIAISYYFFIQKMIKKIPGVIGGFY